MQNLGQKLKRKILHMKKKDVKTKWGFDASFFVATGK